MKLKTDVDRVSVHITPLDPHTAMDDYDSEEELALWQVALAAQRQEFEETELELQELACAAIIAHSIEEARQQRAEQRYHRRLYLVRSDLLPDPRRDTPWRILYQ